MIKFLLALFIPFRRFIEMMDADYDQFILILKIKLTMDDRKMRGIGRANNQTQSNSIRKQAITQIIMGCIFLSVLGIVKSPITFFYFAHTIIMVLMAMTIISEFSTILFDTAENSVIQPLPVKGNTVGLARNAHILIFLTITAFCLSLPSLVLATFRFGFSAGFLFLFTLILNVLFTLSFTNILYLVIMRFASGERLKNVIMYFQIAIIIIFMAGYQFGMQLVDRKEIANMQLPIDWYTYLIPPAFFAGFVEAITSWNFDSQHLIMIAETLLIPVFAIYATGKYLTPVFNQKLMDLEAGDKRSKQKIEKPGTSLWFRLLQNIFTNSPEEKAAFKFMWKMSGRERVFIQTILPSFGYVIFMILMPVFKKGFNYTELQQGHQYFIILYAFLFIVVTLTSTMLNGNYENEGWIYKSLPIDTPANIFKGFVKGAFARFFIPIYVVVGVFVCGIWGIQVLPDVFIALLVIYLITLWSYFLQRPSFPFSEKKSANQGGSTFVKILFAFALGGVIGFAHYALIRYGFRFANLLIIPVCLGLLYYSNRIAAFKKLSWEKVDSANGY